MLREQVVVLFFICLIAFFPYFLRPEVVGMDSYYYLDESNIPPHLFFGVKVGLFLCLFVSSLFIGLLGEAINPTFGLAGVLVFASPLYVLEFLKFENDQFAFPLLFAALWFFYTDRKLFAVGAVLGASLIWQGSILYIIAFGLSWLPTLFPAIGIALWTTIFRFRTLFYNLQVQENWPVIGVVYHALAVLGIFFGDKKLFPATMFFFGLALLNAKYAIHLAPFLAIGLCNMFHGTRYITWKIWPVVAVVIGLFLAGGLIGVYPPTGQQVSAVKLAVQEADGGLIRNDWSWGHVLEYYGGRPIAKGGGMQPDLGCWDCVVVSQKEVRGCECLNCPSGLGVYNC